MAFKITNTCINCGTCKMSCPVSCIAFNNETHEIDKTKCIECGTCMAVCPVEAIIEE